MLSAAPARGHASHTRIQSTDTLNSLESGLHAVFAESTENTSLWRDWVSMFVWASAKQPPAGKVPWKAPARGPALWYHQFANSVTGRDQEIHQLPSPPRKETMPCSRLALSENALFWLLVATK